LNEFTRGEAVWRTDALERALLERSEIMPHLLRWKPLFEACDQRPRNVCGRETHRREGARVES
jgi:hypothetical protein